MRTDKQLLRIFEAVPDWIFQLAGLPSPGRSTLRSITIKELERSADAVVVPDVPDQPLTVVEFQFQKDERVYTRTVMEMAAIQELHAMLTVHGLIFFGYNNLDPQTVPWNRVVRSFLLPELLTALERERSEHPLIAVFKPLLDPDEQSVEREAIDHYRAIKYGDLPASCKATLLEVFVSWLEQRLTHKGKEEIETMLLGELPPLEETQSGKDLIRIGEQRGLQEGWEQAILAFLAARHGDVPADLEAKIRTLSIDKANRLVGRLPGLKTLDDVTQWLAQE